MENNHVHVTAPSSARVGLLSVMAAGLFWGTGGLAGALLAERSGIEALAVAGYRLLIGGGLITAWLVFSGGLRALRTGPAGRRRLLVIGVVAAVFQACYFAAVELISVSLATLVTLGSAPLLVIVGESMIGRRRPAGRMTAAAGVALAGLTLLVGGPGDTSSGSVAAGAALALVSGGGFAVMTMLAARPVAGLPVLPMTGLAFCLGGLVVLPAGIVAGNAAVELQPVNIALLVYLGLVPTALAYTLYFAGLRSVPTGVASLIALLEPLTAAVLGALVLGDRLGPVGISGAVLVGVAVILVSNGESTTSGRTRRRRVAAARRQS
ncbi:DMT family transporter [Phytoactinopolyspora mesophila]|uniref:EamA family transporter n=1 Tax=Phytoactinopolyspora mesophila TaxID=2650750 RepID=A0A7K3M7Y0_9ACTN|nr:EamA family transporter [Phytoactinopolyspora mesophila]NDL59290.1 EamA family transporter [Phytoactinopolyspora mesophila]